MSYLDSLSDADKLLIFPVPKPVDPQTVLMKHIASDLADIRNSIVYFHKLHGQIDKWPLQQLLVIREKLLTAIVMLRAHKLINPGMTDLNETEQNLCDTLDSFDPHQFTEYK